jgi:membrane-associated phospholipid phosphatase
MRMQLQAPAFRVRAGRIRAGRAHGPVPDQPHPVGDRRVVALRLVGGAVVLWGVICLLGELLAHVLNTGSFHHGDLGVDVWFAHHRSGGWNDVTLVGTTMAQTETAIAVTAVVALFLRWRLGRWYESLVLITVMVGEFLVFFGVTEIVTRPRPPVHRLDAAPPTSSFPSGHTAAAIALYGCIALLVLWIYGRRRSTLVAAVVLFCVPVFVGLSRLYRGMHYPTDVLGGALTGVLWLGLVMTTLLPRPSAAREPAPAARRRAGARGSGARRPGVRRPAAGRLTAKSRGGGVRRG